MHPIFLSYASEDRERIQGLISALESVAPVWWDLRIRPGQAWDDSIATALDGARCIVVAWSKEAIASQWVREEAAEGRRRNILVPAFLDGCNAPFGFRRIEGAHLQNWTGERADPELNLLLAAVSTLVGASATSQSESGEGALRPSPVAQSSWLHGALAFLATVLGTAMATLFTVDRLVGADLLGLDVQQTRYDVGTPLIRIGGPLVLHNALGALVALVAWRMIIEGLRRPLNRNATIAAVIVLTVTAVWGTLSSLPFVSGWVAISLCSGLSIVVALLSYSAMQRATSTKLR
jgi:hypothetical protein